MRRLQVKILLLSIIFLSSCSSSGSLFFIRNYEDENVTIHYKYYDADESLEKLDRPTPTSVQLANDILKKKQLAPFFKTPTHYLPNELTLKVIDSLNYSFSIPAKSSIRIEPIYYYSKNIEYIVLNQSDTIRFIDDFPGVENENLFYEDLFTKKFSLIGSGYSLLDVKLDEIKSNLK